MHARLFISLLAVLSFAPFVATAETAVQTDEQGTTGAAQTVTAVAKIPNTTELYQVLREERKVLERQADRHVVSMKEVYETAFILFSTFLVIATAGGATLFWYFFGKTKKEMRAEIRSKIKIAANDAVDREVSELKRRQQTLKSEVDYLIDYKNRKVIWVTPPNKDQRIEPLINVLRAFGLSHIERIQGETPNVIKQEKPDLVILSFDGTEHTRSLLRWIVPEIKSESSPIPLLIFTYSFGDESKRLGPEDFETLRGFDWYLPANVPATLIAQTIALLKRGRDKYNYHL